jgi:hypothetical protein
MPIRKWMIRVLRQRDLRRAQLRQRLVQPPLLAQELS